MDWKKFKHYAWYVVPFYGVYDQVFKKPKGGRSKLGIVFSGVYTAYFIAKFAILPAYLGKGVATHNWHPFRFDSKHKTEQVQKIQENPQSYGDSSDNLEGIIEKSDSSNTLHY